MANQEWEEDWSIDLTQFHQDDQFEGLNFDNAAAPGTLLEHIPFDKPPVAPDAGDAVTNIEPLPLAEAGIQDQIPFDFDFQFNDFGDDGAANLNLAPVDQVPIANFVNPHALFNDPKGPGTNAFLPPNEDFVISSKSNDIPSAANKPHVCGLSFPPAANNPPVDGLSFPPAPQPSQPSLKHSKPSLAHYSLTNSSHRRFSSGHSNHNRHNRSSNSSWHSTPQVQHTTDLRQRRKLSSRPPSPKVSDRSQTHLLQRVEFGLNGEPLRLRSDKIPRHTRNRETKPDPMDWYGPSPTKPANWGPLKDRDDQTFKYTADGELERGRFYSLTEMRQYLFGPLPNEDFDLPTVQEGVPSVRGKRRQGLTLWIGLPGSECNWRYPRPGQSTRCRFRDCLHDNHTIRQGEYWVILDERMNESGDVINPFHNAGYVHLDCLERFFDLLELWQHLDVRIDERDFKYEEHGHFKLGRKHPRITNEVAKWWKDEYPKWLDAWAEGDKRDRGFEFSLVSRLVAFDLENEPAARRKVRSKRKGNDASRHRGNVKEQRRWRTLRDYNLLDDDGTPLSDADKKLQEYLGEEDKERKAKRQRAAAQKQQLRKAQLRSAAMATAAWLQPGFGYAQHPAPNYAYNYGINYNGYYPAAPAMAPVFSAGGLPYNAVQQPLYPQYATPVFPAYDHGVEEPLPPPFYPPPSHLSPVLEEPSHKRSRDGTATEDNAAKRQRREPQQPQVPLSTTDNEFVFASVDGQIQSSAGDKGWNEDWPAPITTGQILGEDQGWPSSDDFQPSMDPILNAAFDEELDSAALNKELDEYYSNSNDISGDGKSDPPASNGADSSEVVAVVPVNQKPGTPEEQAEVQEANVQEQVNAEEQANVEEQANEDTADSLSGFESLFDDSSGDDCDTLDGKGNGGENKTSKDGKVG